MFAAIPLLSLPVLIYNLLAMSLQGGFAAVDAQGRMGQPLFSVKMTSQIDWVVATGRSRYRILDREQLELRANP